MKNTENTNFEERFEYIFALGGGGEGQVCMLEEVYKERAGKAKSLISLAVQEERERVESLKVKMKSSHLCRFNDGEQTCECYMEALSDVIQELSKK